jgi:hypothetical protein
MSRWVLVLVSLIAGAPTMAAQQWQGEVHATYARTYHSDLNSWGAGVQVAAVWGKSSAPVQIGTAVAGDWQRQEHNGPDQWSVGYDMTFQPGGQHLLTPYVGGGVSENWLRNNGSTDGGHIGLQYIVGLSLKPEAESALMLKLELRPGYVQTQEHSLTVRFGVDWSI